MFAAGRLEKIKEILKEYKKVEVTTLVSILAVSEATVRRDLEKLEKENFLKRTYGGAILVEEKPPEPPVEIPNLEEKKYIATIAANFVENSEVIIVGPGTTCLQFALSLKEKKDLTIVTNNVLVSTELARYKDIKVVLTGGNIYSTENSISLVGEFAYNMLDNIRVEKAFLGVGGVDINYGFSGTSTELAILWKKMREISKEIIILADYSKFGKKSFVSLGPLSIAHKIVTNEQVSEEFKQYFFNSDIPIYTRYEL